MPVACDVEGAHFEVAFSVPRIVKSTAFGLAIIPTEFPLLRERAGQFLTDTLILFERSVAGVLGAFILRER